MAYPPVARYDIHPEALEELNALIEQKRRGTLPGSAQVHRSLDSLLLETKCLFYMRDVMRRRGNNEVWYSEPFYCGAQGYKLRLGVYPNGEGRVRGRYESVFIQLLEGEFDGQLRWPFQGEATVKLLDQSSTWSPRARDIEKTIRFTFWRSPYRQRRSEDALVSPSFPSPLRKASETKQEAQASASKSIPEFAELVCNYDSPYEVDDCSWYEVTLLTE